MATKTEILRQLRFGAIIAEQDDLLAQCFISHPVLDDLVQDRRDLVLGSKGAGKSALWKEITENQNSYNEIKDVKIELVTNPSGDPEFREVLLEIAKESFPNADELRVAWRLYLLAQFWKAARQPVSIYKISKQSR